MNQETLDKMRRMRLFGMYHAFKSGMETPRSEPYTADEMTSMLIESEWDDRHNRALDRGLRNAKFRYKATIEQVENAEQRGIDKNQLHRLADGSFIKKFENLLITGSTGTGKSFIASAIGHQACQLGFKVYYTNTIKLMAQLKMAKADGSSIKEMNRLEKQDLLILEDFGIQTFYFHYFSITIQGLVRGYWGTNNADAILDRVVHNAHRIELKGESLRKKQISKESEKE